MAETQNLEEDQGEQLLEKTSLFTDAVYKELSRINGRINQMSKVAIASKLRQLKLSTEGNCEVLKKRLKNYYKNQKITSANILASSKLVPFYVIVDFEATCQEVNPPDYPHEIIEFPAVLVSTKKQMVVDQFQAYCRPVLNPELSPFCVKLTGITQDQVDAADTFPVVLKNFEMWLEKNQLGSKHKFTLVTDGPWDMGRFLFGQCKISGVPYPSFGKKWINIRKTFSNFYKCRRFCLKRMLEHLELEFEGRPHCGLDDACNIARVLLCMIRDGSYMLINERIQINRRNQSGLVQPVTHIQPNVTFANLQRERSSRKLSEDHLKDSDEEKEKEEEEEEEQEEAGGGG